MKNAAALIVGFSAFVVSAIHVTPSHNWLIAAFAAIGALVAVSPSVWRWSAYRRARGSGAAVERPSWLWPVAIVALFFVLSRSIAVVA